ncbi:MAG: carbamoyltransferase C-terminal domain-containing protein [Candidatus Peregrinibacteria bacterium]
MERSAILGVSNLDVRSHDNAACLLLNGKLIAQAEEERFSRRKHAYDALPVSAVRYCLETARLSPRDIDTIAIGWDLPRTSFDKNATPALAHGTEEIVNRLLGEPIDGDRIAALRFVPHHHAHAAVSYYASGFRSAAILVVDGAGETEATTHWHGRGPDFSPLLSRGQDPDSLGFMYEGVSEYLGFTGSEAGKVMGLAAYHNQKVAPFDAVRLEHGYHVDFPPEIRQAALRDLEGRENFYIMDLIKQYWIRYCESLFGPHERYRSRTMRIGDELFREKSRIAAILQTSLEQALLSSACDLREKTGEENLCLGGGVALNCTANGALERSGIFKRTYIYPSSNDAGVALGAALHALKTDGDAPFESEQTRNIPYWGPEYSDNEIKTILTSLGIEFFPCRDDFADIAELLSRGDIIAWFQGRMEIGPRALGARSILADPRSAAMRDRVNQIKGREPWRPLAPSVLRGYEGEYFEPSVFSPFMLRAAIVRPEKRALIPAVVHVDHSSRYQSVTREANPRYWELIESFLRTTGIPMVLNTSFNFKEPIVCSPQDALKTFSERAIDHLIIGRCRVSKCSPTTHGNISTT